MQKLTNDPIVLPCKAILTSRSIRLISQYRYPNVCQMHSNLMGTTRLDLTLEEGIFPMDILSECAVVSDCFLTIGIDDHLCLVLCLFSAFEMEGESISWFYRFSHHNGMICFLYLSILEVREECLEGTLFLGNQDNPTRISIDTMHE